MGQNATYLTDKYPGREDDLWTPCIFEFFRYYTHRLKLPISACKNNRSINDPVYPVYEKRKHSGIMEIDGEVLKTNDIFLNEFLPKIDARFKSKLNNDPERNTIALISPDIFLIRPKKEGVCIIENKPYYRSTLDGNQEPGGAYVAFVKWLNSRDVPCEYLIIHSSSWNQYEKVKKIQDQLGSHFGILLLEHIFLEMHNNKFTYSPISDKWIDYTYTKPDY